MNNYKYPLDGEDQPYVRCGEDQAYIGEDE